MTSYTTTSIKKYLLLYLFAGIAACVSAQSTGDLMLGINADFLKTDNEGIIEKAQLGMEANYFVKRNFTMTVGGEFWSDRNNSFVFGSRWYLSDHLFTRFRGIIGENDFSIGFGGAFALTSSWRLEVIGDYYFEKELALRAGVAYVIRL